MARESIQALFDFVLAHPNISERDKKFAESLLSEYKKKRALTAGRRECLQKMVDFYSKSSFVVDEPLLAKVDSAIVAVKTFSREQWNEDFLQSVRAQLATGRPLSVKQSGTLNAILDKCSGAGLEVVKSDHEQWQIEFESGIFKHGFTNKQFWEAAKLYISGHQDPKYYRGVDIKVCVPDRKTFNRVMCSNKYAAQAAEALLTEPKFNFGDIVECSFHGISGNGRQLIYNSAKNGMLKNLHFALDTKFPCVVVVPSLIPQDWSHYGTCIGGRPVRVMLIDDPSIIVAIQERHITAPKKGKNTKN